MSVRNDCVPGQKLKEDRPVPDLAPLGLPEWIQRGQHWEVSAREVEDAGFRIARNASVNNLIDDDPFGH